MPQTIGLSESAVVVLGFLMKGIKVPVTEKWKESFRELVAAGIMEPVPGPDGEPEAAFRFTEEGMTRREEILRIEEDRIERERFDPPDKDISETARETLRRHLAGDRKVTADNLTAYRELARARIVYPVSGFIGGPEAFFRLTYWGDKLRDELSGAQAS